MKYLFLVLYVVLNGFSAFSADHLYCVSDIPDDLKKNAKAVIRDRSESLEVLAPDHAIYKVHVAITILNENGIKKSWFVQPYDQFSRVRKIKAKLYNAAGELIKSGLSFDVDDYSAISGYSLYEDTRVKLIDPKYRTFPFTVEYSFEIHYHGILDYPDWRPVPDYNISAERSNFRVIMHDGMDLRYREENFRIKPSVQYSGKSKTYVFQASNLKARIEEPYSLPSVLPVVYYSPENFEIQHYTGRCDSWKNFGLWLDELNEGQDKLDDETKVRINEMVDHQTGTLDKIRTLYEYMQNKTRYVSIQVGIGGWQPYSAQTVDELCYGDCKALTNYMKTLLQAAGIKSYYTLIRAGSDAPFLLKDFPSNQFNHAILCVPVASDTIWLECTSQFIPFGFLGKFTDDRDALAITDSGGIIVHTKKYTGKENTLSRKVIVHVDTEKNATALINTRYSGLFYDDASKLLHVDDQERKKLILNDLSIAGVNLQSYKHIENKEIDPFLDQELKLKIQHFAKQLGDRIIIPLNVFDRFSYPSFSSDSRETDIFIRRSYWKKDTLVYTAPGGYVMEKVPEGKKTANSIFGNYSAEIRADKNKVIYIRTFGLKKGIYSKAHYPELVRFFEQVNNLDQQKCIYKKDL